MNNSFTIDYRFELTLQLCFFDGSKPRNVDELQESSIKTFKNTSNYDSNGGDDCVTKGGLDQSIDNAYRNMYNLSVITAYELKGRFLDDLRENAFSGTNGEDAVEHIKYFLIIVDPIDLPNVNHEQLRLAIFLISLVRNASKWFDEFKGSITTWVDLTGNYFGKYYLPSRTCNVVRTEAKRDPTNTMFEKWLASKFANHMMMGPFTKKALWDFWKKVDNQEVVTNEGFFDLEKANNDDEHKIIEIFRIETNLFDYETPLCTKFNEFNYLLKVDTELFTHDIKRTKTYEDYLNEWNNEVDEPWSENRVPYEICDHICEPLRFKNGKTKWPTCNSNENGFCKNGKLPRMVQVGYMTYFQDYEWYDDLMDSSLKDEALKQKSIYEKNGRACNDSDIQEKEEQHKEGRCDLFNDPAQEPPVCKIRRLEMIKYSFGQEEKYVAIKEYEYDDLTRTNEDACHAYQEIFHNMYE
ncbi:hypothetical protein Tco_1467993 [Tanacetum coccineum]